MNKTFTVLILLLFCLVLAAVLIAPIYALQRPGVLKTITVGSKGSAVDFNSVQSAINAVPFGNKNWIRIHVTSGTYREKVEIPIGKRFILLEGEGREATSIESSGYIDGTGDTTSTVLAGTATFVSSAENVVVKNLSFKNTYTELTGKINRALAAFVTGEKTSFYNCGFVGVQDTLCDYVGSHYFRDCYIEGAVDYIFGFGQSIYEGCTLYTNGSRLSSPGWITAQGRQDPREGSGFVFKYCTVSGVGQVYLGRAWGGYSRVLFYKSTMSGDVVPEGWDAWRHKGQEGNLVYAEVDCTGQGSNMSKRVSWMKKLSSSEVSMLTSTQFIDHDGWLGQQP